MGEVAVGDKLKTAEWHTHAVMSNVIRAIAGDVSITEEMENDLAGAIGPAVARAMAEARAEGRREAYAGCCSPDCACCRDPDEDCDCGYEAFADSVAGAARDAALEEAARIVEGGSFLHAEAPTARFGREAAAAIRRALSQPAQPGTKEESDGAE